MPIIWSEGSIREIPVKWIRVSRNIQISPTKELVELELVVDNSSSSGISYFDNFFLVGTQDSLPDPYQQFAYITIPSGSGDGPVFSPIMEGSAILSAYLVLGGVVPTNEDNPFQMAITNMGNFQVVCTKTFVDDASPGELIKFGPINPEGAMSVPGNGYRLSATRPLPDVLIIIGWDLKT